MIKPGTPKNDSIVSDEHHPVYSDFYHMASHKENLTFAVGLREEDAEAMVEKILPLTKIIPMAEKKQRDRIKVQKDKKDKGEEKICMRPECQARRERLTDLNSENEGLRRQLKGLETKIASNRNKIALTEKSIQMTVDKNESLQGQIEDTQAKIFMAEAEVERGDTNNQTLRNDLESLQREIERLKQSTQQYKDKLTVVLESNKGENVVFREKTRSRDYKLETEVSMLHFEGEEVDSDDD